jgi:hypothetical protein
VARRIKILRDIIIKGEEQFTVLTGVKVERATNIHDSSPQDYRPLSVRSIYVYHKHQRANPSRGPPQAVDLFLRKGLAVASRNLHPLLGLWGSEFFQPDQHPDHTLQLSIEVDLVPNQSVHRGLSQPAGPRATEARRCSGNRPGGPQKDHDVDFRMTK